LTACVALSEEDTNAFDVGAEPCVAVLDEAVLAVKPPVGVALADFLTNCWLPVECDRWLVDVVLDVPEVVGAAAAWGAAATASVTPIPAVASPIARRGRADTAIIFLTLTLISKRHSDFGPDTYNLDSRSEIPNGQNP
jgi:hypothetical protein